MSFISDEELKEEFEIFGVEIKNDDVVEKLQELCTLHRLDAEKITAEWTAFAKTKKDIPLTLENLDLFGREIQEKTTCSRNKNINAKDSFVKERDTEVNSSNNIESEIDSSKTEYQRQGESGDTNVIYHFSKNTITQDTTFSVCVDLQNTACSGNIEDLGLSKTDGVSLCRADTVSKTEWNSSLGKEDRYVPSAFTSSENLSFSSEEFIIELQQLQQVIENLEKASEIKKKELVITSSTPLQEEVQTQDFCPAVKSSAKLGQEKWYLDQSQGAAGDETLLEEDNSILNESLSCDTFFRTFISDSESVNEEFSAASDTCLVYEGGLALSEGDRDAITQHILAIRQKSLEDDLLHYDNTKTEFHESFQTSPCLPDNVASAEKITCKEIYHSLSSYNSLEKEFTDRSLCTLYLSEEVSERCQRVEEVTEELDEVSKKLSKGEDDEVNDGDLSRASDLSQVVESSINDAPSEVSNDDDAAYKPYETTGEIVENNSMDGVSDGEVDDDNNESDEHSVIDDDSVSNDDSVSGDNIVNDVEDEKSSSCSAKRTKPLSSSSCSSKYDKSPKSSSPSSLSASSSTSSLSNDDDSCPFSRSLVNFLRSKEDKSTAFHLGVDIKKSKKKLKMNKLKMLQHEREVEILKLERKILKLEHKKISYDYIAISREYVKKVHEEMAKSQ